MRAAGIIVMWGVAPALFFVLGFFVLGPWYANAGWFQKPPAPAVDQQQASDDPARGPWFDESAIPDRLGPVGGGTYTRVRKPRASVERAKQVESPPAIEEQATPDVGEVDVPEEVPVHEAPPVDSGSGVQPPDSID
ncbi:MAG: hypothetical protein AMXMBFR61_19400 [Fimbriimonadales bacterium]